METQSKELSTESAESPRPAPDWIWIAGHVETAILALKNQARWWTESPLLGIDRTLAEARAGEAESVVKNILIPLHAMLNEPERETETD